MQDAMHWSVKPSVLSCAIVAALLLRGTLESAQPPPANPCESATAVAVLAGPEEPGDRLVVTGTVFAPDGVTPAPGVFLYVYNTDSAGYYNRDRGSPPRLHGWIRTGADGRYEYRTVRPASYPGSRIPAHVHTQLWGGGYPPQAGPELNFDGDPFLKESDRERSTKLGRFAFIRPLRKDANGVWRAEHDLRLKPSGDNLSSVPHGVQPCGVR